MSFYVFDYERGVLFEWDCELMEESTVTVDWTEHEVESGATVADYGVDKPDRWRAEGIVTATPLTSQLPGQDLQRVMDADAAIKKIAKDHQPVTLVTSWFVAYATIGNVTSGAAQGDAKQLRISAEFKEFRTVEPQTVQIPASRLKPKPRPRAAPKKKGGASTGTKPGSDAATTKKAESLLSRIFS